jgi:hypothetical protein
VLFFVGATPVLPLKLTSIIFPPGNEKKPASKPPSQAKRMCSKLGESLGASGRGFSVTLLRRQVN